MNHNETMSAFTNFLNSNNHRHDEDNTDDLISISTFADFTGINRSTLIYYDDSGLFAPESRGDNNYRYYSIRQTVLVKLVNVMRALGIPLKKIGALLRYRMPEQVLSLLTSQDDAINKEILRLQNAKKVIHTLCDNIRQGLTADESEICVQWMEERPIVVGPKNYYNEDKSFYRAFLRYCKYEKKRGMNLNFPVGGLFSSVDSFMQNPSRPANFFTVDPDGSDRRPSGHYLVGYTRGYYGQTNDLPQRMAEYAQAHQLTLDGPVYNAYLLDEICIPDPNQYLLQVLIPVTNAEVPSDV